MAAVQNFNLPSGKIIIMETVPCHFIGEPIDVFFTRQPLREKTPPCPSGFIWRGETFDITEELATWSDFHRRGRMARNMSPAHAERASQRGSWGVGRFYFRVRVEGGRIFELYYDRAPSAVEDRKGVWYLFGERS